MAKDNGCSRIKTPPKTLGSKAYLETQCFLSNIPERISETIMGIGTLRNQSSGGMGGFPMKSWYQPSIHWRWTLDRLTYRIHRCLRRTQMC